MGPPADLWNRPSEVTSADADYTPNRRTPCNTSAHGRRGTAILAVSDWHNRTAKRKALEENSMPSACIDLLSQPVDYVFRRCG